MAARSGGRKGGEKRSVEVQCVGETVYENEEVRLTSSLFADDTIVRVKKEMNDSVRRVKEVMSKWQEGYNKGEKFEFGTAESIEKVLRSWVGGSKSRCKKRNKKGGGL